MPSCLGLYIEPNIIKYAKVSKEKDDIRVESFGVKFYDKLGDAINQVVSETYSAKTPISVNLSDEEYRYLYMFSLLNKNDLKKAIETEFDSICSEKGINSNALEKRYALVNCIEDKEKVKVIHVSSNKNSISTLEQPFSIYKVSAISPMGISIANIANLKEKENVVIINMQDDTTITTIVDQKVYDIEKIEEGASEVLGQIAIKENSYPKAYEICKNSTIYTMEGKELLQEDDNEYLEYIMPTIYKIASRVQEKLMNSTIKIDRIYITGTLSVVNNIDLYFQEFFRTEKCELLKPFFINDNPRINIKDYVEVNSAMALALQGLGYGLKDMNFKARDWKDELSTLVNRDKSEKKEKGNSGPKTVDMSKFTNFFKIDFKSGLDITEKWLLRLSGGILALTVIYSAITIYLKNEIDIKAKEIEETKAYTQSQISSVTSDINQINTKTNEYKQLSDNLRNVNSQIKENNKKRKAIPNLLSQIMFAIPQGVQITSIENTTDSHIVINAQSQKYEQLRIL